MSSNFQIVEAKPEDFDWIVRRTECGTTEGFRALKAVDSEGNTKGMVGFDMWTENSVQAHMAVDCPIAWRHLLLDAFHYAFVHADRGIILAGIPAFNFRSLRLAQHFGFKETHVIRDGWARGVDLVLMEMRRENCGWLQEKKREVA